MEYLRQLVADHPWQIYQCYGKTNGHWATGPLVFQVPLLAPIGKSTSPASAAKLLLRQSWKNSWKRRSRGFCRLYLSLQKTRSNDTGSRAMTGPAATKSQTHSKLALPILQLWSQSLQRDLRAWWISWRCNLLDEYHGIPCFQELMEKMKDQLINAAWSLGHPLARAHICMFCTWKKSESSKKRLSIGASSQTSSHWCWNSPWQKQTLLVISLLLAVFFKSVTMHNHAHTDPV